jgi:integrating conjugative element protein (TIGR03757 family)
MKRVAAVLTIGLAANAAATDIAVYTTSFLPVSSKGYDNVKHYFLDAPKKPLAALSANLPDNYDAAVPAAKAMINSAEGQKLLGELKRSYQGILSAYMQKLTDLPAIVVDGQFVVYGVYDVGKAVQLIENHKRAR